MTGWLSKARVVAALMARVLACATVCSACAKSVANGASHGSTDTLLATLRIPRRIEPRLSIATKYSPCTTTLPSDTAIPPMRCAGARSDDVPPASALTIAARAAQLIQAGTNADALHTAAIIDLVWGDSGKSLDQSISYLRAAAQLEVNPASSLSDLSAALLLRAGRTQDSGDLVEAMEEAERAIALSPHNLAARFNLALALARLNLTSETDSALNNYAAMDHSSSWNAELRQLESRTTTTSLRVPTINASRAELVAYAAQMPQSAREVAWDQVLGDWGSAELQHDSVSAAQQLLFANGLAAALSQAGRDPTLADAVHNIESAGTNRGALAALASAHEAYSKGRVLYIGGKYAESGRLFAFAVANSARSSALLRWAELHLGATLVYQGKIARGARIIRQVIAATDTAREPALAARGRWMLGTTLLRAGQYERARDFFQSAQRLFERAGERQNAGAVGLLMARTQFSLGDNQGAFATMRHDLGMLRPYHGSVWAHDILLAAADAAQSEGYQAAALHFANEDVATIADAKPMVYVTEARLQRAKLLLAGGDTTRAASDIDAARSLTDAAPPSLARSWATADLQFDQALAAYRSRPAAAIVMIDSVVAFFGTVHDVARTVPLLVARADAQLARGDIAAATADLDQSSILLATQGANSQTESLRASLLDAARPVFDHLIMLYADAGRARDALAASERGRSFMSRDLSPTADGTRDQLRAPNGEAILEYTLIGDTILAWTVRDSTVRMRRATVPRELLLQTVSRARTALETRTVNSTTLGPLGVLYDWLVRPLASELGASGMPVVIICDGDVASIPFPALYDTATNRYFVETHSVRFAPTMRDAAIAARIRRRWTQHALVIGNPAFDRQRFPSLDPLPSASVEADEIRKDYADVETLTGVAATAAAVETAITHADVVHYAGHAIVNDAFPERSFLVLSPGISATKNLDELSASRIRQLDLRHLRLVVLSACETIRPRDGRSGGLAGLSAAFIAAGAGGVLGTQWEADDRTSAAFMAIFHSEFHRVENGAVALRNAELRMIRSSDPRLRSPAAWAGYRYAGQ